MLNIKTILTKAVKQAYDEVYGFNDGLHLISVVYFGKHNIDYSIKSVTGLKKILDNHNIHDSEEDICKKLTKFINTDYFNVVFEKNVLILILNHNLLYKMLKKYSLTKEFLQSYQKVQRKIY